MLKSFSLKKLFFLNKYIYSANVNIEGITIDKGKPGNPQTMTEIMLIPREIIDVSTDILTYLLNSFNPLKQASKIVVAAANGKAIEVIIKNDE